MLAFLVARGRSLMEYGSAERGLGIDNARAFVDLLFSRGIALFGIEIWRERGGRLHLSALEIWYRTDQDLYVAHVDAMEYLAGIDAGPRDLLAVQFGRIPSGQSVQRSQATDAK